MLAIGAFASSRRARYRLAPPCFSGRGRLKRKRVDAIGQFIFQNFIDGTMAGNATHVREGMGNDSNPEMCLARAVEGGMMVAAMVVMAGVKVAFIYDFKMFRCKSRNKFGFHGALFAMVNGHSDPFSPYRHMASYRHRLVIVVGANPHMKPCRLQNFARLYGQCLNGRNVNSCFATVNSHNPIS